MPAATKDDVLRAIAAQKFQASPDGTCFVRRRRWFQCRPEVVRGPHQRRGYHRVGFTLDGVRFRVLVHRAVLWACGIDIPDGAQVNHINGNKLDNRLENLEVVTASENVSHAHDIGLQVPARGRDSGPARTARLSDDDVRAIRKARGKQADIGECFGIGQSDVSRIKSGERYGWVED